MNHDRLATRVRRHEAVVPHLYFDSKGILTGGIGHALGHIGVPKETQRVMMASGVMDRPLEDFVIDGWFSQDLANAERDCRHLAALRSVDFDALTDLRQEVLVEMCFQMGMDRLGHFVRMWAALAQGDWHAAAAEGLDSKWHREDSPGRAEELMRIMETDAEAP